MYVTYLITNLKWIPFSVITGGKWSRHFSKVACLHSDLVRLEANELCKMCSASVKCNTRQCKRFLQYEEFHKLYVFLIVLGTIRSLLFLEFTSIFLKVYINVNNNLFSAIIKKSLLITTKISGIQIHAHQEYIELTLNVPLSLTYFPKNLIAQYIL